MLSKREAAVIAAYTGVLMGSFEDYSSYISEIIGREVYTHELGDPETIKEIKAKAKPEFLKICSSISQ